MIKQADTGRNNMYKMTLPILVTGVSWPLSYDCTRLVPPLIYVLKLDSASIVKLWSRKYVTFLDLRPFWMAPFEHQMLYISTAGCFVFVLKQKFYVLRQNLPKNQFPKRNYVDSILEWGHSTWPLISKYDVFPASILFGFCITMHYPLTRINRPTF